MTRMSLYDVTKEGMQLEEILSANDGDLTPELEERFDHFLKSGKASIDAACCVVRSLSASEEACKAEAKRLNERGASFARNSDMLEGRILAAIDGAFDGKVKTDMFTVYGVTSADTFTVTAAPDCDLQALYAADPELVRVKHELNKAKCQQLHKEGVEIGGVTITENPGTRYLRIK